MNHWSIERKAEASAEIAADEANDFQWLHNIRMMMEQPETADLGLGSGLIHYR